MIILWNYDAFFPASDSRQTNKLLHSVCFSSDADVIELSSGDEDALQISSESADEDADGATGSDESSGAHINDALNLPDAQGRVLVNINHPAEEKDIYLAPQLARAVKPHQVWRPSLSLSLSKHKLSVTETHSPACFFSNIGLLIL